ncbi:hypothetical protein BHYA_0028g00030 [Botrytis hyacinthi]|uniref:Uncharacterized protein n=1 Tax=Botrytis hyacinthi TaxID=278943 RepID=A0A4Z1H009_9HELO|nr:hypothetical protein BHYA_0028g00030 [Botrytis hyacinthi]
MCKELSCGGDGTKPCICDKSCPYYEPYFASTCDFTWLRGDDRTLCKECPRRAMDDKRNKKGEIVPVAACHNCPGHENHMKGADLPKADPNHRSATSTRAMERKSNFELSTFPAKKSPAKTLVRAPEFTEYLERILAKEM